MSTKERPKMGECNLGPPPRYIERVKMEAGDGPGMWFVPGVGWFDFEHQARFAWKAKPLLEGLPELLDGVANWLENSLLQHECAEYNQLRTRAAAIRAVMETMKEMG